MSPLRVHEAMINENIFERVYLNFSNLNNRLKSWYIVTNNTNILRLISNKMVEVRLQVQSLCCAYSVLWEYVVYYASTPFIVFTL